MYMPAVYVIHLAAVQVPVSVQALEPHRQQKPAKPAGRKKDFDVGVHTGVNRHQFRNNQGKQGEGHVHGRWGDATKGLQLPK